MNGNECGTFCGLIRCKIPEIEFLQKALVPWSSKSKLAWLLQWDGARQVAEIEMLSRHPVGRSADQTSMEGLFMGWLFPLARFIEGRGRCGDRRRFGGKLQLWNPGAKRLFGFSAQEAFGQSLDIIIPLEFRIAHWKGFHEVMRTGQTRLGTNVMRVPALHADGHQLRIAVTVGVVRNGNGVIEGIGAIIREESQKQMA
jgi:PAS domain S-box-containing protein